MSVMEWIRRADALLLDTFYPTGVTCVACGEAAHGAMLCPACADGLLLDEVSGTLCPVCGHPLEEDMPCAFCADGPLEAASPFFHQRTARRLIHQLKFEAVAPAAQPLAAAMAETWLAKDWPAPARLTWVTTTPAHLLERGLDHARILAEAFAAQTGLTAEPLLRRTQTSRLTRQLGKSREERLTSLQGTFRCDEPLSGTILLIDDVMTTGATLRTAAKALREAGADRVLALTATQTRR